MADINISKLMIVVLLLIANVVLIFLYGCFILMECHPEGAGYDGQGHIPEVEAVSHFTLEQRIRFGEGFTN
jgi:hypothetical protein